MTSSSFRVLLSLEDVSTRYGSIPMLDHVSLRVAAGEMLALLGPNGAGKTTALRAISGLLGLHGGLVTGGSIRFDGYPLPSAAAACVRAGIAQVLEGRRIFQDLTIEENLVAGGFTVSRKRRRQTLEQIYELFPVLRERRRETAGYLSGGQQQMLAIGRALMPKPRLLLLDEPSLGLAPKMIDQIAATIVAINRLGTSIVLVEQNAALALAIAQQAVILEMGRVALQGSAADLRHDPKVRELYLGITCGSTNPAKQLCGDRLQ
jgi:branched-chain amino acid transport system ATP-binding protein